MSRAALPSLALLALSGCTSPTGIVCTEEARAGIVVAVRDARSPTIVVTDATVVAREGTFADTARFQSGGNYPLVFERRGTYDVSVEHPLYSPFLETGVQVTADACHVHPVAITAALQSLINR